MRNISPGWLVVLILGIYIAAAAIDACDGHSCTHHVVVPAR
jgi:hypothetical protein